MLNQAAVEALCSAKYLENYLDCLENLPDDLQRSVSLLRELDSKTADFIRDIDHHKENYLKEGDNTQKKRALFQIQRLLVKCQEIGDEKLQLVAAVLEHIESRTRQLEADRENLDPGTAMAPQEKHEDIKPVPIQISAPKPVKTAEEKLEKTAVKRQRRQRAETIQAKEDEKKIQEDKDQPKKKKKKRKVKKQEKEGEKDPLEPIDPDEPVYCLCQQVSYGEMIGCDNDACRIEWFHFNCVGLAHKPKGKWFCPNCRGEKSNIPKK